MKFFDNNFRAQVTKVSYYICVKARTETTTCGDFIFDRFRYNVTRCQFHFVRRIFFHETFAFSVKKVTTFTTNRFGHQDTSTTKTSWMELDHFHIFQAVTSAECCCHTIACGKEWVCSTSPEDTACTTSRQDNSFRFNLFYATFFHVPHNSATNVTFCRFNKI